MKKVISIKQQDQSDCGSACLCSIARSFGVNIPIARIRDMASTDRNGTNIMGLVEAAEEMGFIARGVKGGHESIRYAPLPSIAHIKTSKGLFHFVVLVRTGQKYVKYMDPGTGKIVKITTREFTEKWTGILVLMSPGPSFRKMNDDPSLFKRFLKLAWPFRSVLLQSLMGAVLFSVLGLSTSLFVQKIMDFVILNQNTNLLNLMGLAMLFLLLLRILVSGFKDLYLLKTGHQVDAGLLAGYYRHLLSLPQKFFDNMRTGEILSRMNDAIKIRLFISQSLIELVVAVLTICITLLVMCLVSWQLFLLISSAIPLYLALYYIFDRINKIFLRKLMEDSASLESHLVESVQVQSTIRDMGWGDRMYRKTSSRLCDVLKTSYKGGLASLLIGHSAEIISGLMTILLLWSGSSRVLRGYLSPGELMSLYAMLGYILILLILKR